VRVNPVGLAEEVKSLIEWRSKILSVLAHSDAATRSDADWARVNQLRRELRHLENQLAPYARLYRELGKAFQSQEAVCQKQPV
jgi:hypothetical protein